MDDDEEKYLISFIDQLMRTSNQLQSIDMIELRSNLVTKKPTSTTWRNGPSLNLFGIRPDEITESAFVGNLLSASDHTDLIDSADLGTQTTVDAEDFTINDSGEHQEIEDLAATLPDRSIAIFGLTFFVKPIDLSDLTGLVIASNEGDLVGVPVHILADSNSKVK